MEKKIVLGKSVRAATRSTVPSVLLYMRVSVVQRKAADGACSNVKLAPTIFATPVLTWNQMNPSMYFKLKTWGSKIPYVFPRRSLKNELSVSVRFPNLKLVLKTECDIAYFNLLNVHTGYVSTRA